MNASNTPNQNRDSLIQHISTQKDWDIIIAGGGITGVGIAREAVRFGLKVLLVERQDFSWGTSSKSSKMVHGGLRYLGQGDYKTTMHSVREREKLLNEAGGLVNEMAYVMPHYKGVFPPPWMFNILLRGYDFFAGKKYRQFFKAEAFTQKNQLLNEDDLLGVTKFADAVTDDSRLVMRVLHQAQAEGASLVNYMSVDELIKNEAGDVIGVNIKDAITDNTYKVHAKVVVNATGAWADELKKQSSGQTNNKIRPSRGSHIVISRDKLPVDHVYTLMHPDDKRALFIFPWETRTVIGTTDIDHPTLNNDEVGITQAETDYLLTAGRRLFPDISLSKDDVIATWAGVRPLISSAEDGKKVHPSKEKRNHSIWQDNGLITVSGGKLTTFRLIALDVLKKAESRLGIRVNDDNKPLFEKNSASITDNRFSQLDNNMQARLIGFYGKELSKLLDLAKDDEFTFIPDTNTLWAEIRFACTESLVHLDDLMLRRTRLGYLLEQGGKQHFERIKTICQEMLAWDDATWNNEVNRYSTIWQDHYYLPKQ